MKPTRRWLALMLSLVPLGAGCSAPSEAEAASWVARSHGRAEDAGILIELREGYLGDDREWWLALPSAIPPGAEALVFEVQDEDAAERAFDAYLVRCLELSEQAHDLVVRDGIPSWLGSPQYAREWHLIVPNAELTAAVGMSISDYCHGVFNLVLRRRLPDLQQVVDRVREVVTWSGDGTRIAFHAVADRNTGRGYSVVVVDGQTGALLFDTEMDHFIQDVAWSPDGSILAVLGSEERRGNGLLERLADAMGHGVPYVDFFLVTIDLATGSVSEYPIEQDLQYGEGLVVWDERAVRSMVR